MAWSRRTRRRVLLLGVILVVLAGGVFAARLLLDWRRTRAFEQARADGLAAFEQGDHARSLQLLGPLFRQSSDDLELVRAVAISRLELEEADGSHFPRAAVLLQRVVELDPGDLEARRELVRIYPRLGFLRETLDTADAILDAEPQDAEALEARVQVLAAMGRWAEAADACARLVQEDPGSARWKQLQISTALASGLEPAEAVELAKSWPKGPVEDGLDDLVLAALFALAGEPSQANELIDSAVERGAADGSRLESMLSMLADLGRGAEAERLIRGFAAGRDVDDVAFARLAGRWAFSIGRADFLVETIEALPAESAARVELAVPLAMLSFDADAATRRRWLAEAERDTSAEGGTIRSRDAILSARQVVEQRDLAAFRRLEASASSSGSTVIEKIAAARAALAIGDAISAKRFAEMAERQQESLLGSLLSIDASVQRGELAEALEIAVDSIVRHPGRLEPAVALVTIWADADAIPPEVEERARRATGASDPLALATRLVEAVGINSATAIPLAAAAIDRRRPEILEDAVVAMLAEEPPPVGTILALRQRLGDQSPVLAERLRQRLLEAAPEDPRIMALAVGSDASDQERIASLRAALPLEAADAVKRAEAWSTLIAELAGVSGEAFRQIAEEAMAAVPGDAILASRILYDPRTWGDREFARSAIDRVGSLRGAESPEQMLARANWILAFDRDNQTARVEAIAKLNEQLLADPDSYAIGATLLRLMIADSATDPQSAIRLGRRLIADRPGAIELYPIVIELMQAQGMLADADRLLREFEAIDVSGEVSARQRAASSFRQGNLEELVRNLTRLSERSGAAADALTLGRARESVGDLVGAEQSYRVAMADEALKAEAMIRLGPVLQRLGRLGEFEAMLAAPGSGLTPLQRELALAEVQLAAGAAPAAAARLLQASSAYADEPAVWRGLAVAMLAAGDRGGAADAAIRGLRLAPDSEEFRSVAVVAALEDPAVLERLGSSTTANALPEVVTESIRLLRNARGEGGRLQPDASDLRAAKDLCSRFGDAMVAWRVATALHQAAGQPAEAKALATAAARRFPGSPDPVQWQVLAASAAGDLDQAIALCTDWRRLRFPDVRPVDEAQAALELARSRPEAAIVLLRRHRDLIVRDAALRPGPYRALLASLMMTGAVREAADIERANLAASEQSRTTWAEIAAMAPYERGLEAMSILEASSPADAGSRARMIGRWVAFHERHPNGRGLDRARALLPRTGPSPADYDARLATVARADIERVAGDAAAARATLQSVLASYPPGVQDRAKTVGTLTGQAQLDLFREIEPLIYARNNLAMLLVEQDASLDEALSLVQQCLEILPGNPDLRDTQAQVFLKLGRLSEAEQSAVMAIRAYPTNPAVLLTGAEILAASGRVEDSRLLLQRVRDILAQEPWPSQQVESRLRRVAQSLAAGS